MSTIRTAVLLAAGEGSRIRAVAPRKPLCRVGGRALIDHALTGLAEAAMERVIVVTGYGAEEVEAHLAARAPLLDVEWVRSPDWSLPNGVSALAARPLVKGGPVLLAMCDHLVDPDLYAGIAAAGPGPGLRLGIDRDLCQDWIDQEDVTRVRTEGSRIVAIGKGMEDYDAYDTGVFAVAMPFFDALEALERPSISEAVSRMAAGRAADTLDCTGLDWIDVDDVEALRRAEQWLARQRGIDQEAG